MSDQPCNGPKYQRMVAHWDATRHQAATAPLDIVLPVESDRRAEHIEAVQVARWGQRYRDYRQALSLAASGEVIPPFPLQIDMDVIDTCNLACTNCSENIRPWTRTKLDLELIFRDPVFETGRLAAANLGRGSEPFLLPEETFALIAFLRQREVMDIWTHTNGHLITPEIIRRLVDLQVSWVTVSIDAFSDQTYQQVRGRNLARVVDNIHALLAHRAERGSMFPLVRVSAIALPENLHELSAFHDYWMEHVEAVDIQPFWDCLPIGADAVAPAEASPYFRRPDSPVCSLYNWRMGVHPSGRVAPCCMSYGILDDDLCLGTIGGSVTLLDLWRGDKLKRLRADHAQPGGPCAFKACRHCLSHTYQLIRPQQP